MNEIIECYYQLLVDMLGEEGTLAKAILDTKGCQYNSDIFFFLESENQSEQSDLGDLQEYIPYIDCNNIDLIDKATFPLRALNRVLKNHPLAPLVSDCELFSLIPSFMAGNPLIYFNLIKKYFVDFVDLANNIFYLPIGSGDLIQDYGEDGSSLVLTTFSPLFYLRRLNYFINVDYDLGELEYRVFDATNSNTEDYSWIQYLTVSLTWGMIFNLGKMPSNYDNANSIYNMLTLFQRIDLQTGKSEFIGYFVPNGNMSCKYSYVDDLQNMINKNPYMGIVDKTKPIVNWMVKDPFGDFVPSELDVFPVFENEEGLHYYWPSVSTSFTSSLVNNVFGDTSWIPMYVFVKDTVGYTFSSNDPTATFVFSKGWLYRVVNVYDDNSNRNIRILYKFDLDKAKENQAEVKRIDFETPVYSLLFISEFYPLVIKDTHLLGNRNYTFPSLRELIVLSNSTTGTGGDRAYKTFVYNCVNRNFIRETDVQAQVVVNQDGKIGITVESDDVYIDVSSYGTINGFVKDIEDSFFYKIPDFYDNDMVLNYAFKEWSLVISNNFVNAMKETLDQDAFQKFESMFGGIKFSASKNYLPLIALQFTIMVNSEEQLQALREFDYLDFSQWLKDNSSMPDAFKKLQEKIKTIVRDSDDWDFSINYLVITENGVFGEILLKKKTAIAYLPEESPVKIEKPPQKISI